MEDLCKLDPIDTFNKTHSLVRSIEEFINIAAFGVSNTDFNTLGLMNIEQWNPVYNSMIDRMISPRFGQMVSDRFKRMTLELYQILFEFRLTGYDFGFRTILEATGFYQSRRRHIVTILYLLPTYCKGKQQLSESELLRVILHLVDFCLVNITALQRQLILSYIFPDFKAIISNDTITGNYQFDFLEDLFTEPERISIIDPIMEEAFKPVSNEFLQMPEEKIFSRTELINGCELIRSYFTFFKYNDPIMNCLVPLLQELSKYSKEDYFVSVSKTVFEKTIMELDNTVREKIRDLLVLSSNEYILSSNSHHPFIEVGRYYKSNFNLILRFLYNYKNISLNKSRRYRIRSGFIFEDKVKTELLQLGFEILKVKRIERKEFDVITKRAGAIYNFQCKNNFIDITLIEKEPEKFAKRNRALVRYYMKSLDKEKEREHLIINKYGIKEVSHFVISRFPVIGNEPSIILFKDLKDLF
ncbi:MAG: hypothetical protein MI921_04635 [Cytophagales bacterium]|nr:hypothetical protein [Cytophagales bacterium]